MLKYVLFDLDGTLTESAPGIINSLKYAFRRLGAPQPNEETLKLFVGPPLIDSFMRFCNFSEDMAINAVDVYREYFVERGMFENAVYSGIPKCLRTLRDSDLTLGVATSKPQPFCERILEHFGLTKYFDVIKGIPLDGEGMTKSEVIAQALSELCVTDKDSAIMVGDRAYDVIGARENGINCVGVLYGYGSREELEQAGAADIAENVEELTALLLNKR